MRRRIEVFAAGTDWVQLVWRGSGRGAAVLELGGHTVELDPVAPLGAVTVSDLAPSTTYDVRVGGRHAGRASTLARPPGRRLARVATISDLHVGETGVGHFPRLHSTSVREDWAEAHPVWCLGSAIDEITKWSPQLLVAKGDLAHRNRADEYAIAACELLRTGAPVIAIGGNHDGGNMRQTDFEAAMSSVGIPVASAVQIVDLDRVRVIAADTRVEGHHSGQIEPVLEELIAAAAGADGRRVLVFLHHQLMVTRLPYYLPTGIPKAQSEELCRRLAAVAPRALVTSGHTHRNRVRRVDGLLVTEVGSPKDYPGVWAGYEVFEGGLVQTLRRIEEPRALAWNELTRTTAGGVWKHWAPGRFEDRCVSISW
jgi:predicted phosphodiesterase